MKGKFEGFASGQASMTPIPAAFFNDLLPLVDDLAELKVLLFCMWALPQKGDRYPYLRRHDFTNNAAFMRGMAAIDPDTESVLTAALERATEREALLATPIMLNDGHTRETLYFMNTERGREGVRQIEAVEWRPGDLDNPVEILPERPTIYRLYEDNIGLLTPMIAEELKDMEATFAYQWIEDAFREAVKSNKRSLRYIHAILKRWQSEGRADHEAHWGRDEEDPERYVSGPYADFIDS